MGHILLVSDNEVINSIYLVNLKAYVGANVTVKDSAEEAIKLLEVGADLDAILSFSKIKNEETSRIIFDYLKEHKSNLPFVLVGKKNGFSEDVKNISSIFDIKGMVRTVAKILQITAKEMAETSVPEFYPIPLKLFIGMGKSYCDVYYRAESEDGGDPKYVKMWEKSAKMDKSLEKLIDKGVRLLYIPANDRLKFINNISSIVIEQLENTKAPLEDKIEAGEQAIELVANKLTEDDVVTEEVMKVSTACVKSMKSVIEEVPKLNKLLSSLLENKTKYVYLHSILGAYIATGIINNIPWGAEEHAEKISFVLFFHDIFLVPIFDKYPSLNGEDDLLFGDILDDKEKEMVLNHARIAGELVSTFKLMPLGADAIIKQHHGVNSGTGFAVNFKDDISPLAKVVIISEEFVSDILKAQNSGAEFDRSAAIDRLRQKFTKHTYKKIIDALEMVKF